MADLPSQEDLGQLPIWAAVSLAARTARRVLPGFRQGYPDARTEVLESLERAVLVAEGFAAQAAGMPGYSAEADGDRAVDVNQVARKWASDPEVDNYSDAVGAAAYAAAAAAAVQEGAPWADRRNVAIQARRALTSAAARYQNKEAIVTDFECLAAAAREGGWDDSHPVPPSVYPPLD